MTAPTRRGLLGGAAVLAVAPIPSGPPHPDAALLAACAAFDELERAYLRTDFDLPPGPEETAAQAERDRLADAQEPWVAQICELRAVTRDGQAARARSLALWDRELMEPGHGDTGKMLTRAIVRDLIG